MSDNVPSAVASLSQSVSELNSITDAATERVNQLEHFLESCGVGFDSTIPLHHGEKKYLFSYIRVSKRHRFALKPIALGGGDYMPWAECSRELKLKSLPLLPHLMESVVEKVKAELTKAQFAMQTIDKLFGELNIPKHTKSFTALDVMKGVSLDQPPSLFKKTQSPVLRGLLDFVPEAAEPPKPAAPPPRGPVARSKKVEK